jgi:hypothetical protein
MSTGIAAASISESFTWISGESKRNAVELPNYSILDCVCAVVIALTSLVALSSVLPTVGIDALIGFRRRLVDALVGFAFGIGAHSFPFK